MGKYITIFLIAAISLGFVNNPVTTFTNAVFNGTSTFNGTLNFNTSAIPVSGAGVNFTAGTRAPTTVSTTTVVNILNQFAFGTWTPSIVGITSSPTVVTYATQSGYFLKINIFVFYTFYLGITGTITGGGGQFVVSGTPYVTATPANRGGGAIITKDAFTTSGPDYVFGLANSHGLTMNADGNTTSTAININNIGSGMTVSAQGFYITTE